MVDGVNKRRQSRLPKEDPRTLSQVGADLQQGLGTMLRGAMSAGEFVAENPRLVGETLMRGASYAVPGSSTAEFVGMAPELTSNELAPGVMDLLKEGKYGEAASLAAFLGLDLAQLSAVGTIPATLIKGSRGLAKGIGELADIAEQQRLLTIESGGPPIGGGGNRGRKELQRMIGAEKDPVKKQELIDEMKALGKKEPSDRPKMPTTSPEAVRRLEDTELAETGGGERIPITHPSIEIRANVLNGIETLPMQSATGKQYLEALLDKGISKDEIKNSGLGSFLQQNPDRLISRGELRSEYEMFAPIVSTRQVSPRYSTLQRIARDKSRNYREVVFQDKNELTGFSDDVGIGVPTQVHYGGDLAKGQIGHARIADIDGAEIGQVPGSWFELLNEYQDDYSKVRKAVDDADPEMLETARIATNRKLVPAGKKAIAVADERIALMDEVLDELSRLDPDNTKFKFESGYGSPARSMATVRNRVSDNRNEVSEEMVATSDDMYTDLLDLYDNSNVFTMLNNLRDTRNVFKDVAADPRIADAGFDKDLLKRVNDAAEKSVEEAYPEYGLAAQEYRSSMDRWDAVSEALSNSAQSRVELTPDNVRKLRSPKASQLLEEYRTAEKRADDAHTAFRKASDAADANALRNTLNKKKAELASLERKRSSVLDVEIPAVREELVEARRAGAPVATIEARLSMLQDSLRKGPDQMALLKKEISELSPQVDVDEGALQGLYDKALQQQGEFNTIRERLRTEAPEAFRAEEQGVFPGRLGGSKEQHRLMLETLLEQAAQNPSSSGFIIPSPKAIDASRGEGEQAFQFLYSDLPKSVAKKFQKRYPGAEVFEYDAPDAGDLSGALVIKFPTKREPTDVLVHKYAKGGMVYKGIGSMGKEVL